MNRREAADKKWGLLGGACSCCSLRELPICRAIRSADWPGGQMPFRTEIKRDRPLDCDRRATQGVGILRSGYFRMERVHHDGRRDVLGLLAPGDMIGNWLGQDGGILIEAVTPAEICSFDPSTMRRLLNSSPILRQEVLRETLKQYTRLQEVTWIWGALGSRERIIAVLLIATQIMPVNWLSERSGVVHVVFSRRDWADFAKTTTETLCRTLGQLSEKSLIKALGRGRFHIVDLDRLARSAGLEPGLDIGWGWRGAPVSHAAQAQPIPKRAASRRWAAASLRPQAPLESVARPV